MFPALLFLGDRFCSCQPETCQAVSSHPRPAPCIGGCKAETLQGSYDQLRPRIPETIDPADFKIFFTLFRNNLIIDDLGLHLIRSANRASFINIPAVTSDPLFFAFHIKFFESKIGGQKLIFVLGLKMIAKRIPPIVFRMINYAGP